MIHGFEKCHLIIYSWLPVTWTLYNSNLPLTWTNFHFPSDHFLYNFTVNNSNLFYFPWRFELSEVDCTYQVLTSLLYPLSTCTAVDTVHFNNKALSFTYKSPSLSLTIQQLQMTMTQISFCISSQLFVNKFQLQSQINPFLLILVYHLKNCYICKIKKF